ncbi:MAG: hypothetical protein HYZ28_02485 [Myxococcales bacterium]|nr:hypothetical protein [Myxococcales bacterium]
MAPARLSKKPVQPPKPQGVAVAPAIPPPPRALAGRSGSVDTFRIDAHGAQPPIHKAAAYSLFVGNNFAHASASLEGVAAAVPAPHGVEAGKPLVVSYFQEPSHLGRPDAKLTSVKMHYRIDGRDYPPLEVVGRGRYSAEPVRLTKQIDIPADAKGELEYWFECATDRGETLWDSKFGENYRLNIIPVSGGTIRFDDLWGESVKGPLQAGGTLRLSYDADRVRQFLGDQWHRTGNTLSITGHVSFDGRPPVVLPISTFDTQHGIHLHEAAVEIPSDARKASIWFKGTGVANSIYDSDFGANYTFDVQR